MSVNARAHSGSTKRQFTKIVFKGSRACYRLLDLICIPAKLLAEAYRRGIMQMGPADF